MLNPGFVLQPEYCIQTQGSVCFTWNCHKLQQQLLWEATTAAAGAVKGKYRLCGRLAKCCNVLLFRPPSPKELQECADRDSPLLSAQLSQTGESRLCLMVSIKNQNGIHWVCICLNKPNCLVKLKSSAIMQPGFNPGSGIGSLGTCTGAVPETTPCHGWEGPILRGWCRGPLRPFCWHGGLPLPFRLRKATASGKPPWLLSLLPQHG